MQRSRELQLSELPRIHRRRANVAHLPGLHDIVQRARDLLGFNVADEPVDLQHVDVRPQLSNTRIHGIHNVFPAQALRILVRGRRAVDAGEGVVAFIDLAGAFRHDDKVFAGDVVLRDGFADDDFRLAVRVHVGGVPGVDAGVVGGFEHGD